MSGKYWIARTAACVKAIFRYRLPSLLRLFLVFPPELLHRPSTTKRLGNRDIPDYEILDDILRRHIEHGEGLTDLVQAGYDQAVVMYVLHRVAAAERTRRYAPPGVKVTSRAFGQDLHMPISNAWRTHPRVRPDAETTRAARDA